MTGTKKGARRRKRAAAARPKRSNTHTRRDDDDDTLYNDTPTTEQHRRGNGWTKATGVVGEESAGGRNSLRLNPAQKAREITAALRTGDLTTLRQLALSQGGFLNDRLRRKAWPALLTAVGGTNSDTPSQSPPRDAPQVALDVIRSLTHLIPPHFSTTHQIQMRAHLSHTILSVLAQYPYLHYYQGYHDIASTILLTLGPTPKTIRCLETISLFHLRDFMAPTLQPALQYLSLLLPLLRRSAPDVHAFLAQDVAGFTPWFCLSWVLTWFTHDLADSSHTIAPRLLDFFLASNPLMPLYLVAATVISRRADLFALPDPDYAIVHHFLSSCARFSNLDHVEDLIHAAGEMYARFPPPTLQGDVAALRLPPTSCVERWDVDVLPFWESTTTATKRKPRHLTPAECMAQLIAYTTAQQHNLSTQASSKHTLGKVLRHVTLDGARQMAIVAAMAGATAVCWWVVENGGVGYAVG
ncbi:rab-GTPase-TBC domain-containing protein [Fimicolochytrium jonesii]|uniref:rab-GTPase-TBC domain-containing protein n=1 Tax=Fimicolochytrium jonesii TaxID=1396493 RepID=UPI0022FDF42F|nr:rab-GTPase-TBC domain-containing protein [Fimicolochytrium jonesii]KAI8825599.1 rab-GTPase-TBC domain-containing protein [Fimicolochytrium jonesii]